MNDTYQVVVTVGTDHHRFDRLIDWVDAWLAPTIRRGTPVDCLVQHGPSRPPRHATGVPGLPRDELVRLMAESDAIVGQAGPGTITDALAQGRLPVVVPRSASLGEHVDDHQVAFSARVEEAGLARVPTRADELAGLLDSALADPTAWRVPPRPAPARDTARRLGDAVEQLVRDKPPRRMRDRSGHGVLSFRSRDRDG